MHESDYEENKLDMGHVETTNLSQEDSSQLKEEAEDTSKNYREMFRDIGHRQSVVTSETEPEEDDMADLPAVETREADQDKSLDLDMINVEIPEESK